jgi:hypothetical protein
MLFRRSWRNNSARRFSGSRNLQIVEKFRAGVHARDEQVVSRPRASHVQQMALRVVFLFEIVVVGDGFDPGLKRNYFVVTSHYNNGSKFEPLCQMHRSNGNLAARGFNVLIEHLEPQSGFGDRSPRAI